MGKGKARRQERERAPLTAFPRLQRGDGVVLALLSGTGVAVSAYLTYVHQRLRSEPFWESLCAISTSLNCDTVITSPLGAIGGVPLSAFAVWFYLLVAVVAATGLARRRLAFPHSPELTDDEPE